MTEQRPDVEPGPSQPVVPDVQAPPGEPTDNAAGKAQEVKEQAAQAAAPAKEKAQQAAGQAKQQAQVAAEQAKSKAAAQVDEKSTQAGRQIGAQSEALEGVAGELRKQGKDGPAQVAEQAAEKVKKVGEYLQQADGEKLVQAAQDVARENPAAAAAVGAAAGFAAGRVIKASSPDDDPEADPTTPATGAAPADPGPGAP